MSIRNSLAGLLLLMFLGMAPFWVGEAANAASQQAVKVEKQWKGGSQEATDNEAWQHVPLGGIVVGPKAWEWLWKQWHFDKELPAIDFEKELVLVAAGPGPNTIQTKLTLSEGAHLKFGSATTLLAGPGFAFIIQKISRDGIKSVNGKTIGVEPVKDAKTGFVVGGKNETALIKKLTSINGIAVADLEKKMRPKELSSAGFLGQDEKLPEVLAADNDLVLMQLGLTHQELARHLLVLADVGKKEPFTYLGRKFKVTAIPAKNFIDSPFADGTKTNSDVTVFNLDNGKKLQFSLLVPLMIERYGFYEGQETPYRVDPRDVVEVLDFLKKKE